jgi:hypothetical protein
LVIEESFKHVALQQCLQDNRQEPDT